LRKTKKICMYKQLSLAILCVKKRFALVLRQFCVGFSVCNFCHLYKLMQRVIDAI
jgi:hypothetical protein